MATWTLDIDDTFRPRKSPKKPRLDTDDCSCSPGNGSPVVAPLLLYKGARIPGKSAEHPDLHCTGTLCRPGAWQ